MEVAVDAHKINLCRQGLSPACLFIRDPGAVDITDSKALYDNFSVYRNALSELALSIRHAERVNAGKRQIRKLQRKFKLLQSYISIVNAAANVLEPYHAHPLYIVNRFWLSSACQEIIIYNGFPGITDFFEWYCDSATISSENAQDFL